MVKLLDGQLSVDTQFTAEEIYAQQSRPGPRQASCLGPQ
jgi:hypothetical protein